MRLSCIICLSCLIHVRSGAPLEALPWSRTSSDGLTTLTVASGYSYEISFADSPPLRGAAPFGVQTALLSSGVDGALGPFDEVSLTGGNGSLGIRFYNQSDAFVFLRRPATQGGRLPAAFPNFHFDHAALNASVQCIGWSNRYFFPGGVAPSLERCQTDGPVVLVQREGAAAMAISALDHFSANSLRLGVQDGADAWSGHTDVGTPPLPCDPKSWGNECAIGVVTSARAAGWNTSAVVLARAGVTRAIRALGSILRRSHNTTRLRAEATQQLSAWNDNQAGYSWWSVGNDQMVWGEPEKIYHKLKAGYDAAGIPIRLWEPDNALAAVYGDVSGWIYEDWHTWNKTLYPSQGNLSKDLGVPLALYLNGWAKTTPYAKNASWKFISYNNKNCGGQVEIAPADSLAFHSAIFANAMQWGFKVLFTDFLGFRGGWARGQAKDVPVDDEPEHMWLGGMTKAAQSLGVEVQYCMAAAHQLLMSLEWPAVTNARSNGDGGLDTIAFRYTSAYAAMVGIGWSKDNLRTADKCYNPARAPNGSVLFACDSVNKNQFVNGKFAMQILQTALAALSMGPVGIADQLSAPPDDDTAMITSNKTLVMATCAANGMLLQPSYPATPIDDVMTAPAHSPLDMYATYTAVAADVESAARSNAFFFTLLGWVTSKQPTTLNFTLMPKHLEAMVDESTPVQDSTAFEDPLARVPQEAFLGAGTLTAPSGGFVWFRSDFTLDPDAAVKHAEVQSFGKAGAVLQVPFQPLHPRAGDAPQSIYQVNVAPAWAVGSDCAALLGEAGKVTTVSAYRFALVSVANASIQVLLRGEPGEKVPLLFATRAQCRGDWVTSLLTAVVGPNGSVRTSYSLASVVV